MYVNPHSLLILARHYCSANKWLGYFLVFGLFAVKIKFPHFTDLFLVFVKFMPNMY